MQKLRKFFTISVMMMTVLSMSVVVAPQAEAAASAGDLIKMDGLSSVYYLAADGKRYVFPNEATYFSWYSDFSGVVTIPQSELESYPLGANVTMRPGTNLVKITTDPKVYAVEPGGQLRHVLDQTVAMDLYGDNWNQRIVDVPDSFFTNYTVTGNAVDGDYPEGTLIQREGEADIYYIADDGKARKIANESAMMANRFQSRFVIEVASDFSLPAMGDMIESAENSLIDTSEGGGAGDGNANAGSGLSVALSAGTPGSDTIVVDSSANAQAHVPFTEVRFTASNDGAVKVNEVTFKRKGISSNSDLDALYLYDDDMRLTEEVTINSSGMVHFNSASGLFEVPAGETKTITLVGDMYYNAGAGKTIGFSIEDTDDVVTNGATVSGSFPVNGNLMSTANVSDLGQLSITDNTAGGNVDPDEENYKIGSFTFAGTAQPLEVEKIVFTEIGSIQRSDVVNFELWYGGQMLAQDAEMNDSFEVEFDMSNDPLKLTKGQSKPLEVRADIVKGSTRTFRLTIQNSYDVMVKDTTYDVYVLPYTSGSWSVKDRDAGTGNYDYEIQSGSLSISRASGAPTGDVPVDGTNITVGKWNFRASGEDMKVKDLDVVAHTSTTGGLSNGKVYVDGIQVGNTKNLANGTTVDSWGFGSTFIVKAGETAVVELVADVKKTTGTSYSGGETASTTIATGASDIQKMSSLGYNGTISALEGNNGALTITAAALSVYKYSGYGNQTLVAGTSKARMGSFVLKAGAAEGVDVNSITLNLDSNEDGTVSNMYLENRQTGEMLGNVKVSPSTSNAYSVDIDLDASESIVIDVYADIKSGSDIGTWDIVVDDTGTSGTGKDTSSSVTNASETTLQTITIGTGALYLNDGSHPTQDIVLAGTTDNYVAEFNFSASNEAFTVEKLAVKTENNFASSTAQVTIEYEDESGATREASSVFVANGSYAYATATFTGLEIYVPRDGDTNVKVYIDTVSIASGASSGANGKIYVDYNHEFRATGSAGTVKTDVGSEDKSGNNFYLRKTKPTFAKATNLSSPATGILYEFTVVADSRGNVEIKQLGWDLSTSGVTVSSMYLYDKGASEQLTDTEVNGNTVRTIVGAATPDSDKITVGTTPKTYQLRGTITGWSTGDSITVSFKKDTSATLTQSSAAMAGATADPGNDAYNIWSDRSANDHSTTSADWTNGFLLKNMDDTQSFQN